MKKSEKILTITASVLPCIIFTIVMLAMCFMHKEIAVHFNLEGEVTRYGSRYELFILAFTFYLLPLIMTIIFSKVKMSSLTRVIGLSSSIVMSLTFIGVAIYLIVIISNKSIMNHFVLEQRISMILTLLGCALFTLAHVLPFVDKQKFKITNKKIELLTLILTYICGLGIAVGCVVLNNYYSFIIFFILIAVLIIACVLLQKLLTTSTVKNIQKPADSTQEVKKSPNN